MIKSFMNWSGGKDSALALYDALSDPAQQVDCLLTSVNHVFDRISMHGVRRSLLEQQVSSIGIPLKTIELPEQPGMQEYEKQMNECISGLKEKGFQQAIYGDIFLEDLKIYREEQLGQHGISCHFPLWKKDTSELMKRFLGLGFKTIVVCVNSQYLNEGFCGRVIDETFINDLPQDVDICGENGEFHTFVFDGPIFSKPVSFKKGEIIYKEYLAPKNEEDECFKATDPLKQGFYFCDLLPINQ